MRSLLEHNTYGLLAIAAWVLAFVVAALALPDESAEPLSGIVRGAALHLESIEGYARISPFPDKTRLMLLLAWIGVPVAAAATYPSVRRMLRVEWLHAHRLAGTLLVVVVLGMVALVLLNVPEPTDLAGRDRMGRMLRLMSRSQLGLGFVAAIWSLSLGFGLAVAAATIREFLRPRRPRSVA